VDGTRNLSDSSVRNGVNRFIYVSSCAVYGEVYGLRGFWILKLAITFIFAHYAAICR